MQSTHKTYKKSKRPPMTAEEARSFERISKGNISLCLAHFTCGCSPYTDLYTYKRWKAQGYHVIKGEHGLKLPLIKTIDSEIGEPREKLFCSSFVFCRHQVESDADQRAEEHINQ